ncbi:hypothetical protein CYMTET_26849 [Cymbomonas tetramitiformis]|uniref:Protein kinase domain-containing protein n=1 Tax=Cymbomonas tetramitiformis TaxID=36881 RepID=A0AAE0FSF3_9CHLO|nr:hypothetical protein CYMTET_26849 [Cymbomonas tetramitiformis]
MGRTVRMATAEAANATAFSTAHAHLPYVVAPVPVTSLTTCRVLVLEWIDGRALSSMGRNAVGVQEQDARDVLHVVQMGVQASLVQLLQTGLLHGDPHPGNLMITPGGRLAYLDFGSLCTVLPHHSEGMVAALAHVATEQWGLLAADLQVMQLVKPGTNLADVEAALRAEFSGDPPPYRRLQQTPLCQA